MIELKKIKDFIDNHQLEYIKRTVTLSGFVIEANGIFKKYEMYVKAGKWDFEEEGILKVTVTIKTKNNQPQALIRQETSLNKFVKILDEMTDSINDGSLFKIQEFISPGELNRKIKTLEFNSVQKINEVKEKTGVQINTFKKKMVQFNKQIQAIKEMLSNDNK